jgi:hypothetical protein
MSDRKRKSYTPSCRREAAHLVIDTGRPIVRSLGRSGSVSTLNRPRSGDWLETTEEWSHAGTKEVSERAA